MVDEKICRAETLDLLVLLNRIVKHAHQHAEILQLVDLLEKAHVGWRAASQENAKLSDLNARLKRQIDETALAESKELNRGSESALAAANAQIDSLRTELREYQLRSKSAADDLKNVTIRRSSAFPQPQGATIAFIDNEQTSEDGNGSAMNDDNNANRNSPIGSSNCCSTPTVAGQHQPGGGLLSADGSLLGPVTWTPTTPGDANQRREELIRRMKRGGPLFEKPY